MRSPRQSWFRKTELNYDGDNQSTMITHIVSLQIVQRTNILVGASSHPATNMPKHNVGNKSTQNFQFRLISIHKHRGRPVCASRVSHFWTPFWTPLLRPDDTCTRNSCAASTMNSTSVRLMRMPNTCGIWSTHISM